MFFISIKFRNSHPYNRKALSCDAQTIGILFGLYSLFFGTPNVSVQIVFFLEIFDHANLFPDLVYFRKFINFQNSKVPGWKYLCSTNQWQAFGKSIEIQVQETEHTSKKQLFEHKDFIHIEYP